MCVMYVCIGSSGVDVQPDSRFIEKLLVKVGAVLHLAAKSAANNKGGESNHNTYNASVNNDHDMVTVFQVNRLTKFVAPSLDFLSVLSSMCRGAVNKVLPSLAAEASALIVWGDYPGLDCDNTNNNRASDSVPPSGQDPSFGQGEG
jgi:hypothetical protein